MATIVDTSRYESLGGNAPRPDEDDDWAFLVSFTVYAPGPWHEAKVDLQRVLDGMQPALNEHANGSAFDVELDSF
jgi:hypothetical protein